MLIKRIKYLVITIIIAFVIIFSCFVHRIAMELYECEQMYHAVSDTLYLVSGYIERHGGVWPRSWDDLDEISSRIWNADETLRQKNFKRIQHHVSIDFDVDINKIETESIEQFIGQFDAIRPIKPYLDCHDSAVKQLYNVIWRYQRHNHIRSSVVPIYENEASNAETD